ncbi:TolC family protein [Mucilaginibacter sp. RS28]|uniref:TolC family protein n=1 Tax=Mucilaginibacter straminoryzae TaxID=2932774 RepID=A0A9X1X064_9SPHI|nr:TolC family protein [Mucilaginibacter straminoryzae]MCJ8208206.1 TolC family protein [Mucilaginibacter straminoryzae]
MKKLSLGIILGTCLLFAGALHAQEAPMLTLKNAIEIALQNNYNIKLAQNNNTIAKNNVTPGAAGMLPNVQGTFTSTNSIQNTVQTRADNTVNRISNAHNTGTAYAANMNWTIFDGFLMFANYDALKERRQLSDVLLKDTIQATVANVLSTYFDLVNQREQIKALQGAIAISKLQLGYANEKFKVGRASKLDVLNAQVNYNTDTANLITQKQQFKAAQIRLNQILVRDLQTNFNVADTIIVDDKVTLGDVLTKAQSQNPAILASQINQRLAEINIRQVRSTRYPQLSVNGGYSTNNSRNPAGFAREQNSKGLNYGLVASINIFDGFNQWRRERNAKLQSSNAVLDYNQTKLDVEAQINTLYSSYLSGLDLVKLGESNVSIAQKNLQISLEKYRLGNITPLEIREAQRNYLLAQSQFFSAQYQSKIAEITLKQITASIDIQ